jgi:tetratricopeptide (TPR) repeat protein
MIVRCRNLIRALSRRRRRLLSALLALLLLAAAVCASGPHLRAWYHYESGQNALERRAFDEAREHAAICLQVWPNGARSRLLAARAARRAGLLEEARQHLEACPSSADILEDRQLERILLRAQRGGLADVEKLLLEEVELEHPQSPAILEVLTWEWMRTFQLGEALQALEVWRQRRPRDPEPLVRHGWVSEHLLRKTEAVDDYRQALVLDPNRDPVRLRLAEILVSLHRSGEAAEQFEYLVRKRPDDPTVVLGLARCRFHQARLGEAEKLLDDLLARHPNMASALGERGRLALAQRQLDQAEAWLRRAVTALPHDKELVYNLVQCLERQDKHAESQKYETRLRQMEEDAGRMGGLIEKVLQTPKSAPLRHEIGVIFLRNGFEEDGLRWLRTALEQDPSYRPAHQALAEHYQRMGQLDLANRHRQAAGAVGEKEPPPPAAVP